MLELEFLKLLKRKWNYFLFLSVLFLFLIISYKYSFFINYLNITFDEFYYGILFRLIFLIFSIFLAINIIVSYRDDYKCKFSKFIIYSKTKIFNNLLSKILVNLINVIVLYLIVLIILFFYFYYVGEIDFFSVIKDITIFYNIFLSIILFLFISVVVIFILTIFNNTNLAISLSLLFFIGSKYLTLFLISINEQFYFIKYSFLNILNLAFDSFFNATNYNIIKIISFLGYNSLILFLISIFILKVKNYK